MPYTAFFQDDNATFSLPRSQQQQRLSLMHRHPLSPQEKTFAKNYTMDDYMSIQEDNEMFKVIDAPILQEETTTTNSNNRVNSNSDNENSELLLENDELASSQNKTNNMLFIPNSSNNMFLGETDLTDISRNNNNNQVVIASPRQQLSNVGSNSTPSRQFRTPQNMVNPDLDLQLPIKNLNEEPISRTEYFKLQNDVYSNVNGTLHSNGPLENALIGSNSLKSPLSPTTQMHPSLSDAISPGLNVFMTNHILSPFQSNSEINTQSNEIESNCNTSDNNLSFKETYSETHSDHSSQSASAEMIHIRMLVSDDEASRIIGLKGQCLFKLRDKYDVEISISKHEKNCSDRILFCGGHINNVSNAIKGITNTLIENMSEDLRNRNHSFPFLRSMLKKPQLSEFDNVTDLLEIYSIRLIVSNSQLSSIIGKNGHTIKALISKYNIKIIASNRFLPDSDERVLEVQGTSNNIADSIVEIGKIIYHRGLNIEYFGERHYYPHIIISNKSSESRNKSLNTSNHHHHNSTNLPQLHNSPNKHKNVNNTFNHNKVNNTIISRTKSNCSNSSYSSSNGSITSSIISKENVKSQPNSINPLSKEDPNEILSSDMFTASIEFPDALVGAMMGIKGNRISNLRNLTKTKITLERYMDPITREEMARFIVKSRNRTNVKKANSILKKNLNTELKRLEQNV